MWVGLVYHRTDIPMPIGPELYVIRCRRSQKATACLEKSITLIRVNLQHRIMSKTIETVIRNAREAIDRDDRTFYSSIDMFENYFLNRARFEKSEEYTRILQELLLLRSQAKDSFAKEAAEKLVYEINKQRAIFRLAAEIATEQGSEEPTVEHKALAEEKIENEKDTQELGPDEQRL